jgi:UDP-hydrolysing UDP-N-acetyl-D-glucosamine 2-epimerase
MDVHFRPRRIACLSTSRADAGIYRPLLQRLARQEAFDVALLAGGTHTQEAFGHTLDDLSDLSCVEIIPVEHRVAGDTPLAVAETAGGAVTSFARSLSDWKPDLAFVLGDRTEMLAATLAALVCDVPIAHLHGGDASEGAVDEQCRHAITKLAHLHFPALPQHADRIAAMGEARWRIHVVGAPALDALTDFRPCGVESLRARTGLDFSRPTVVVLFHPETLSPLPAEQQVHTLLDGLSVANVQILILGTNADVGHERFRTALTMYAESHAARYVPHLPQREFWSCLTYAQALVGNSSAGILEAASFRLPVINVGERQAGRVRPANVLDVPLESGAIRAAIAQMLSDRSRWMPSDLVNPYGDGRASERIVQVLENLSPRERLLKKQWVDGARVASADSARTRRSLRRPRRVAPG